MIKESVNLNFEGISIHLVPELPTLIEERIQSRLNGWKITHRDDDVTLILSNIQRASIASDSRKIKAVCIGPYIGNFESIKSVGEAIKEVANISKRRDVTRRLSEKSYEFAILCEALPIKEPEIKASNAAYSVVPERNLTVVGYFGNFYNFLNNFYKHTFPKMFKFYQ